MLVLLRLMEVLMSIEEELNHRKVLQIERHIIFTRVIVSILKNIFNHVHLCVGGM